MQELSVVLAVDESYKSLSNTIRDLVDCSAQAAFSLEIVVIDISKNRVHVDEISQISQRFQGVDFQVLAPRFSNPRIGQILRIGLSYSRGRNLMMLTSATEGLTDSIPALIGAIRNGSGMALIERPIRINEHIDFPFNLYRLVYSSLVNIFFGRKITDSTNGLRMFDRRLVSALGISSQSFAVFPEMTFKLELAGSTISYIPISENKIPSEVFIHNYHLSNVKFKFYRDFWGYMFVLSRVLLHRTRIRRYV